AAALPRPHRAAGLPSRARHADLGSRHRRARGARPAQGVRRGRRDAARHRRRVRRRRVGGAHRVAARRRGESRRRRPGHQGRGPAGPRRCRGGARPGGRRLPRVAAPLARPVPAAARHRPRRPVAGARLVRRRGARGDAVRARHRGEQRQGGVRRGVEPQRVAECSRRDLAAGGAGTGAAGRQPGGVLAARPVGRGGGAPRGGRDGARGAGLVAAGPRGADGQVPHRHAGGLAGRVPALRRLRRGVPERAVRTRGRGGRPRGRRTRLVTARGGAGVGARPAGGHRSAGRRPDRRPAARVADGRGVHAPRGAADRARRRLRAPL
ncbi:MAG: Aldo/keto reductase, SCO1670 family, partial [uncultured Nocardioidaceae bacterium]